MSDLKALVQNVVRLKAALVSVREEQQNVSYTNRHLHNEMKDREASIINEIYDATGDLEDALKEATGVVASMLPDLQRANGYVIRKDIALPRRLQDQFED